MANHRRALERRKTPVTLGVLPQCSGHSSACSAPSQFIQTLSIQASILQNCSWATLSIPPWEFSATLSIPEFTPQFTCTSAIFDKQRFFDRTITCVQPNCSPMLSPCTLSAVSVYPYQSASPIVIGPNLFRPDSVCLGITFVFVISQVLKKVFSLAL